MVNLKTFRFVNNLTQDDLADFLGLSKGTVSKMENGKLSFSEEYLMKILANEKGWNTEMLSGLSPLFEKLEQKSCEKNDSSDELISLRTENKLLREQLDRALGIIEKFAEGNKY